MFAPPKVLYATVFSPSQHEDDCVDMFGTEHDAKETYDWMKKNGHYPKLEYIGQVILYDGFVFKNTGLCGSVHSCSFPEQIRREADEKEREKKQFQDLLNKLSDSERELLRKYIHKI